MCSGSQDWQVVKKLFSFFCWHKEEVSFVSNELRMWRNLLSAISDWYPGHRMTDLFHHIYYLSYKNVEIGASFKK